MTEPTTEADARALNDAWRGLLAEVERIRAEAVAAERARWRRIPGTYRTDRGIEVVVGVDESAGWIVDEFPEEVAAILAAERARITAAVLGLRSYGGHMDTTWNDAYGQQQSWHECASGTGLSRAAVLAIVNKETET